MSHLMRWLGYRSRPIVLGSVLVGRSLAGLPGVIP